MSWGVLLTTLGGIYPILFLILSGFVLAKIQFLGESFIADLNKLAYWVVFPAFLFISIARAEIVPGFLWSALLILFFVSITVGCLGFFSAKLMGKSNADCASIAQCSFRANNAFFGLPVIVFSLPDASEHLKLAVLALVPVTIIFNVLSVLTFVFASGREVAGSFLVAAKSLIFHPLLLSSAAGLLVASLQIPFPMVVGKPLELLGAVALPVALLCIGGTLSEFRLRTGTLEALLPVTYKLAVAPAVTWLFCILLGLDNPETLILVVYAACPTAASAYTLASQMGGNTSLTSACIALSTIFSVVPLVLIMSSPIR